MEFLKEHIDKGNLELASISGNAQTRPIAYEDVKRKVDISNQVNSVVKCLEGLSLVEKFEWVNIKKLRANKLFSDKKYQEAIEVYLQSLMGLDLGTKDSQTLHKINHEYKYPVLMNIASCYYMLDLCDKGLAICDKVLKEYDHPKCYYKKGCLALKAGYNDLAREAQNNALKFCTDADLRRCILHELSLIKGEQKKESQRFRKMLEVKEEDEVTLSEMEEEEQLPTLNIDHLVRAENSLFYRIYRQVVELCKRTKPAIHTR